MKHSHFDRRECFETPTGCFYFFGRHGYIQVQDEEATAFITAKTKRLATPDFSERTPGPQEIKAGVLKPWIEYLEVPVTSEAQRRLGTYFSCLPNLREQLTNSPRSSP